MYILVWANEQATIKRLPVYTQTRTIDSYLYQTNLEAMSEFTICFWLNAEDANDWNDIYILSISVPGRLVQQVCLHVLQKFCVL